MTLATNQDQYVFDQSDDEQRATYVTDQLVTYNLAHSAALPGEHPDYVPLHLYVLDRAGTVVGGVLGRTHAIPFWFEVGVLWVEERLRHHGLGRQLLERAEAIAVQRGCRYARLATSNFQAPAFYEKLGYTRYGMLENCPPGETVFYFWKTLDTTRF